LPTNTSLLSSRVLPSQILKPVATFFFQGTTGLYINGRLSSPFKVSQGVHQACHRLRDQQRQIQFHPSSRTHLPLLLWIPHCNQGRISHNPRLPIPRPPEQYSLSFSRGPQSSDLGPAPHPSFLCRPTPKQLQDCTKPGGSLEIRTTPMSNPKDLLPTHSEDHLKGHHSPPPSHSFQTLPDQFKCSDWSSLCHSSYNTQTQILCHETLHTCMLWTNWRSYLSLLGSIPRDSSPHSN